MTKERREELRELLGKASPLPWHWGESRSECLCEDGIIDAVGDAVMVNCGRGSGEPTEDDVRLIIAAVNELRALLDSDERLEGSALERADQRIPILLRTPARRAVCELRAGEEEKNDV